MDKKTINEEQFKKLVINETKKIFSEESPALKENITPKSERKITFDKVESLIKEMEQVSKSIKSISLNEIATKQTTEHDAKLTVVKEASKPNRSFDVDSHNNKKNITHVDEGEKDKWNRMMKYQIPSDENR